MKENSEEWYEARQDAVNRFATEFALLVRKYAAMFPGTDFIYMLQDQTSCFSPYVWSDINELQADAQRQP